MEKKILNIRNKMIDLIKAKPKIALIILAVVMLLIIICFATNKQTFGNTSGNLDNTGKVAQNGKWAYYIQSNGGIYKIKGNKTIEISERKGKFLNIVGSYIYFSKYNEDREQFDLVKMKTNGKNEKILVENIDEEVAVTVVDGWIYYSKSNNFVRCNTKGEDKLTISKNNVMKYQISGNYVFYTYTKDGKEFMAKMKLNGEKNEKIAKIEISDKMNYCNFCVINNRIYYILLKYDSENNLSYTLYSMNLKGENNKEIFELSNEISNINMNESAIYYTMLNEDIYEIHKVDYKGKKDEKIVETEVANFIGIVENWVFYLDKNDKDDVTMFRIKISGKDKQEL